MSSKRSSLVPAGPKPPTSLSSSITIADHAQLTGVHLITIRSQSVIHPRCKIISTYAPVTISAQCIVSERSSLGLLSAPSSSNTTGVFLEERVVVEVGAIVEAERVGEGSVIECNSRIGKGAVIGKVCRKSWLQISKSSEEQHCKIGPLERVAPDEIIPDYTVLYGNGRRRLDSSGVEDLKNKMTVRNVEILRKLIPSNLPKFQ